MPGGLGRDSPVAQSRISIDFRHAAALDDSAGGEISNVVWHWGELANDGTTRGGCVWEGAKISRSESRSARGAPSVLQTGLTPIAHCDGSFARNPGRLRSLLNCPNPSLRASSRPSIATHPGIGLGECACFAAKIARIARRKDTCES